MIGYGPESNHFVIELTFNYQIKSYDLGNISIKVKPFGACKKKM